MSQFPGSAAACAGVGAALGAGRPWPTGGGPCVAPCEHPAAPATTSTAVVTASARRTDPISPPRVKCRTECEM
ncbi:hypothetical protein GCM10009738_62900 [Kitasatospora viridis]